MKRTTLFVLVCTLSLSQVFGQRFGIEALRDSCAGYPLLMEKFGQEVEQKKADYFFLIDVSGSMNKYQNIVIPALNEFFSSLPEGDYVNVIHFGAKSEVVDGCYGTIDGNKIQSLRSNTNQIYFNEKPKDKKKREDFWNNTDLENAMHTLANEMHQLGLNDLKFVFIITDFEHDPPASRRGQEDWTGIRRQFEQQQAQSNVNVVALQLPGNPTHLKQVCACFPETFNYQSKTVADGSDLASWFTRLKNNIMLERFRAVVSKKVQDANLIVEPEVDINGCFKLNTRWQQNELFDSININKLTYSSSEFIIQADLPVIVVEPKTIEGKFRHVKQSFLPTFRKMDGKITAYAQYAAPQALLEELQKLGINIDSATATCDVGRTVFSHPWSLGWCIVLLALILLYCIMFFVSLSQSRSCRIRGTFYVSENGATVTNRLNVTNRKKIGIGKQGYTLQVPNCQWDVEIYEKTYPALVPILHLIRPQYRVILKRGASMKVANRNYRSGVAAPLARKGGVVVDNAFTIHWN